MARPVFNRLLQLCLVALMAAPVALPLEHRKPYPKTRSDNVVETMHGVKITDPYRWLEDKDNSDTRAWLKEQIDYTDSLLGVVPGRNNIHRRLEQLIKIDTISVPFARGNRYFVTKRRADQNQPVIYVREGLNGKDDVLIDANMLSPDQTTSVFPIGISRDGKLMAYGVRQGGEDEVAVSILDVDTRKDLADRLPKARYAGISFKPDRSGFYYSRFSMAGPRLHYHSMGTDPAKDEEIFGKGYGPAQFISASLSEDGRYLAIFVSHGSSGDHVELYYQDLVKKGPITPIVTDLKAGFFGAVQGDELFLQTNLQAPNSRIIAVDLRNPARDRWREVVPESGSVLSGFSLAGGKLFTTYLENVSTRIKMFELSGKHVRDITFPMLGSSGGITGQWEKDDAFYVFSSFAQPATIYRYQVSTGKQEVWARINVPVKSDEIEVKQVWYESKDKTRIPMFVAHKKGIKLDGKRPTFLTAYGGFNVSLTPGFSATAAYWVENGGVFAQPNLRGGGEFGEKWHKAGMLANKQNVFDDFIAAAEWLIKNNYTNVNKLAIAGGSNGGLLVGAAMTQRPELFQAVICAVPLLDMVRYHKFLVARFWVPEYGSSEDPEQFKYISKYSPYHQVKPGTKYPAVILITGDSDTRVDPLHARKMTALLQASTGSDRPILLHYDTKSGHSGGKPVNKQIVDLTDQMAFLFWQLGVTAESDVKAKAAVGN